MSLRGSGLGASQRGQVGCGKELVQVTGFLVEAEQIGDWVVFYVFFLFPLTKTGCLVSALIIWLFMGKAVTCVSVQMLRWVCLHERL